MSKLLLRVIAAALSFGMGAGAMAAEFRLRAPDVAIPPDLQPGELRRIIHPFPNWVLICDENLKERKRICNVTQTFVDDQGRMAFSWSLAATEDGQPAMLLRAPAGTSGAPRIEIDFSNGEPPYPVTHEECDPSLCIFIVPVGPRFRSAIADARTLGISIRRPDRDDNLVAPLAGLSDALAAIE